MESEFFKQSILNVDRYTRQQYLRLSHYFKLEVFFLMSIPLRVYREATAGRLSRGGLASYGEMTDATGTCLIRQGKNPCSLYLVLAGKET